MRVNSKTFLIISCLFLLFFITAQVRGENEISTKADTATVQELLKTASDFYIKNNDKLFENAQEALQLSRSIKYDIGEANSLRMIGIYYDQIEDYDSSLIIYEQSRELCEKINYYDGLAKVNRNIGVYYYRKGDYIAAIQEYYKALEVHEELDQQKDIAICYNNIGLIYRKQEDYNHAISNYQEALQIFESLNDTLLVSKMLNNLGVAYKSLENYDEALKYYMQALEIYKLLGLKSDIEKSYVNIGNVYNFSNKLSEANEYYQKAFQYSNESGNLVNKSSLLTSYGMLCAKQNNFTEAYKCSKEAYEIAKQLNNPVLIESSTENLSETCYKLGRFKEAYEAHVIFKTIQDSITSERNYRKLVQKEFEHEREKENERFEYEQLQKDLELRKKQTILYFLVEIIILILTASIILYRNYRLRINTNKILETKNTEIEEINAQLKEAIATKDKLFSIITHDLKNQFNSILGFSGLLENDFEDFNANKRKDIISSLSTSAEIAHSMLDKLLIWSRSQKGQIHISKVPVNINHLIEDVINDNNANAKLKGIRLNNETPNDLVLRLDENTMSISVRNIISNAIKYTSTGGFVSVNVSQNPSETNLIIKDNGVGMSEAQIQKLFKLDAFDSTWGTNNEKGSGLGLILCKEFTEKNGGTIHVKSKVNEGTEIILTFKNDLLG